MKNSKKLQNLTLIVIALIFLTACSSRAPSPETPLYASAPEAVAGDGSVLGTYGTLEYPLVQPVSNGQKGLMQVTVAEGNNTQTTYFIYLPPETTTDAVEGTTPSNSTDVAERVIEWINQTIPTFWFWLVLCVIPSGFLAWRAYQFALQTRFPDRISLSVTVLSKGSIPATVNFALGFFQLRDAESLDRYRLVPGDTPEEKLRNAIDRFAETVQAAVGNEAVKHNITKLNETLRDAETLATLKTAFEKAFAEVGLEINDLGIVDVTFPKEVADLIREGQEGESLRRLALAMNGDKEIHGQDLAILLNAAAAFIRARNLGNFADQGIMVTTNMEGT